MDTIRPCAFEEGRVGIVSSLRNDRQFVSAVRQLHIQRDFLRFTLYALHVIFLE